MMFTVKKLKLWLKPLKRTPLHPMWLTGRHRKIASEWFKQFFSGIVLDVGCGDDQLRKALPDTIRYIGIDYPATMALGYTGRPNILADAAYLPFASESVDTICFFDVLEHLPDPDRAISEASRILKQGGSCLIQVPFLYPLHDEPHDYQRWTRYGLERVLNKNGFNINNIHSSTVPMETAAALFCTGMAKGLYDAVNNKSVIVFLAPVVLLLIPFINIAGWLLGRFFSSSAFMPSSYYLVATVSETNQPPINKY